MGSKQDLSKKFILPLNIHLISNIFGARAHYISKHIFRNFLARVRAKIAFYNASAIENGNILKNAIITMVW